MFLAPTYAILPWQSSEPVLWVRLSADHDKLAESLRGAWNEAGEPCACLPRARGGGTLTHRCSTTLGFPAASETLSASAKEISLWQACFIWDNTNQVRPVAAWLHLFNAKFQIGCYCRTSVIVFRAKKCDVKTEQTHSRSESGTRLLPSAALLVSVWCWVGIQVP